MEKIQVPGAGCAKWAKLKESCEESVADSGIEAEIDKVVGAAEKKSAC